VNEVFLIAFSASIDAHVLLSFIFVVVIIYWRFLQR
jgi:hypothetical protein